VAAAYGLLFVAILGPALFSGLTRGSVFASVATDVADILRNANPLSVAGTVLDLAQPPHVRWSLLRLMIAVHLSLSAALLLFSAYGLRRFSSGPAADNRRLTSRRRTLRPPLKDRPLVWREMFANRSYSRLARAGRGLLDLLVVLAMLGALWQFLDHWITGRRDRFAGFAMWLGTTLESVGLLLAAAWASNSVAGEREKETWTTLVSTPLEAREIIFGKLVGSLYAARSMLAPILFVWLLAGVSEPRMIPAIFFTLIGVVAAAGAGSMLGIFFSFRCANATRALGATLGCVFAAITLGSCCTFPLAIFNPLYLLLLPGFATMIVMELPHQATVQMTVPLLAAGAIWGGIWLTALAVHLGGAWLLWAMCISSFDRLAGRIDARVPPAIP
jgi:hypothetical protein